LVWGPETGIVTGVKILAITPVLATLLLSAIVPVASAQSPASQPHLRVGVHVHEPFVLQSGQEYQGFSIDLWKEIAADLGRGSDFIPYQSLPELLEAVSSGKADVGVSGIFVTEERLKTVDFSQPFLHGGLQVMVHERRGSSFMKVWNGLRESGHLKVFGLGICVILVATLVLTVAERRWNSEFHPDWANGLSESFYHVMSIVMTGKSSHKGLPGPWGRVLGAFWIAFGVGVVAYITSSVTSIMTVNSLEGMIKGPQNLPGHRVGIIPGTVGAQYCADHHLDTTSFGKLEEAVQALVNRRIDAIVLDAMTLQWYDNSHPELPITEVGPIFDKKSYAFALPIGSTLRHGINKSLLKQNESGFLETLRKQYFGEIQ
jgi:polar amino acid transport system substrate-binding protein